MKYLLAYESAQLLLLGGSLALVLFVSLCDINTVHYLHVAPSCFSVIMHYFNIIFQ